MNITRLIKIINVYAFIFIILTCVLKVLREFKYISVVFILVCLITFLICSIRKRGFDNVGYLDEISRFKKGLIFISVVFLFTFLVYNVGASRENAAVRINLNTLENTALTYIIIYLVSSIILIRTSRSIDFIQENKELIKINLRYTLLVLGIVFLISVQPVRETIFGILAKIYSIFAKMIGLILNAIAWVLTPIVQVLFDAFKFIITKLSQLLNGNQSNQLPQNNERITDNEVKRFVKEIVTSELFVKILEIGLILLVIFIMIKILKNKRRANIEEEKYDETREFIKAERTGNIFDKIPSLLKPKTYMDTIRYYYKKFLKLCISKNIDIRNSDTTLQINEKSSKEFNPGTLDEMRNIYIKIRYNDESCDKKTVDDYCNYYKNLNRYA